MTMATIKRRLQTLPGAGDFASDDGPIFSTVAKLVRPLDLAIPHRNDLEPKKDSLRLGRELLRWTKYEQ